MVHRQILVACLFALAWPARGDAPGDTSDVEPRTVDIAVLDVVSSGGVDPVRVQGLSGLIAAEVAARPDIRITTSQDIRSVLGYEAERQLLDCESDSICLAELAGAMGVQYLLTTEVSRFGRVWLLNMSLTDASDGRPVHRVNRRAEVEEDLLDLASDAVTAVLARLGIDAAPPPTTRPRARRVSRQGLLTWSAVGAGGAAIVAGSVLYGSAWRTHGQFLDGQDEAVPPTVSWQDAMAAQQRAGWGVGLLAGGAALTASALVLPLTGDGGHVAFVPAEGGGLVVFTVRAEGPR